MMKTSCTTLGFEIDSEPEYTNTISRKAECSGCGGVFVDAFGVRSYCRDCADDNRTKTVLTGRTGVSDRPLMEYGPHSERVHE